MPQTYQATIQDDRLVWRDAEHPDTRGRAVQVTVLVPDALLEHSRVRLRRAVPQEGLEAGAKGTVVHVYNDGAGYEVEFVAGRKTPAVVTLEPSDLEPLAGE